ncbi:MAG: pyruvate, water dikinase regulatory protein [Pseudomonadota bacterium]
MKKRHVFFVSDRTGITAETLGESLLTQFPDFEFHRTNIPFVSNALGAEAAASTIQRAAEQDGQQPIVFSTLTDPDAQAVIANSSPHVFDLFGTFIDPLEAALGVESSHTAGRMHGIKDSKDYETRLDAVNYSLGHDDGLRAHDFSEADVVLIGVSRCGKTPTCLYLAMHYSLKAANYPLTEDDFDQPRLPAALKACRKKIYGLTIVPEQLSRIRHQRRPEGAYSTLPQCRKEVANAEALFKNEGINFLDTTTVSIEEIAATIVRDKSLH